MMRFNYKAICLRRGVRLCESEPQEENESFNQEQLQSKERETEIRDTLETIHTLVSGWKKTKKAEQSESASLSPHMSDNCIKEQHSAKPFLLPEKSYLRKSIFLISTNSPERKL
jgi:hypothetical protein